jgi:hypothetical protein
MWFLRVFCSVFLEKKSPPWKFPEDSKKKKKKKNKTKKKSTIQNDSNAQCML